MTDKKLMEKLLAAKSVEEMKELLKESGQDEAAAARIWDELSRKREEAGRMLSSEEMETISGGRRDFAAKGCCATVEPGSYCWSNDACGVFDVIYDNKPIVYCDTCGRPAWHTGFSLSKWKNEYTCTAGHITYATANRGGSIK